MTTRVYLLSSFANAADDTHWASPYAALRRAFTDYPSAACTLVDSPDDADLILVCPRPRNPVWPAETFRNGVGWRHRAKCVVLSTDDDPTMTHKGFYTSLRASRAASPLILGGFYPSVTFGNPPGRLPATDLRYVFSFLGSFATHPIRRRIGELAAGEWRASGVTYLVQDTSRTQQDIGVERFQQAYVQSLAQSRFILCPRGMSPSSLRVFEAMKGGRVPVIVSDEWVAPSHLAWQRFAMRIAERDVAQIPRIVAAEAGSFAERADAARTAWQACFEPDVLAATVTRWGMELLQRSGSPGARTRHSLALLRQLPTWRFVRRGIASRIASSWRART